MIQAVLRKKSSTCVRSDVSISCTCDRPLGATGIKVSAYCLGAMSFGAWGNPDHSACVKVIHEALENGINFVDTADVYSQGESEEIVGEALKGWREACDLATKANKRMGEGLNCSGNSRRWIFQAVEASLRRLDTEWIDLYQMHRPDPTTDIEETLSALTDSVHQGKIRAFGSSTFPADLIVESQWVAERRGLGALPLRVATVLVFGARRRAICASHLSAVRPWCHRVVPASGRLA